MTLPEVLPSAPLTTSAPRTLSQDRAHPLPGSLGRLGGREEVPPLPPVLPGVPLLEPEPQEVEPLGGRRRPGLLVGQGEPQPAQDLGEPGPHPFCHRLG